LTKKDGTPRAYAARAAQPDDQWQDALVKLFPVEVFMAYLAAVALITKVEPSPTKVIVSWVVFGVGVLATVVYMIGTWDPDPGIRREELRFAWPQLILAVFAFSAWAFTLGGAFAAFPWYEQWIGGVVLIIGGLLLTGVNKLIGTFAGRL